MSEQAKSQEPTVGFVNSPVLLSPRIEWGTVMFDGAQLPYLTIIHPVHGPIVCLVPRAVGLQVSRGLLDVCTQSQTRQ